MASSPAKWLSGIRGTRSTSGVVASWRWRHPREISSQAQIKRAWGDVNS